MSTKKLGLGAIQDLEGGMSLVRASLPKMYENQMVKECRIPKELTVALIYREDKPYTVYGDFKFLPGDDILLIGQNREIIDFISKNNNT